MEYVEYLKSIILKEFGSFKEFTKMGIDSFNYIEQNLHKYSDDELHEIIKDCEVQRLIPSYMPKSRWEELHRRCRDELVRGRT